VPRQNRSAQASAKIAVLPSKHVCGINLGSAPTHLATSKREYLLAGFHWVALSRRTNPARRPTNETPSQSFWTNSPWHSHIAPVQRRPTPDGAGDPDDRVLPVHGGRGKRGVR